MRRCKWSAPYLYLYLPPLLLPRLFVTATFDLFMVCTPPLPPASAGWPAGYSHYHYRDNLDLCSALSGLIFNGFSRNVGCLCPHESGELACSLQFGDSNFYTPPLGVGTTMADGRTWENFCKTKCRCTTQEVAEGYRFHMAGGDAVFSSRYPANLNNGVMPYGMSSGESDNESTGSNNVPAPNVQAVSNVASPELQRFNETDAQELCSYPPLQCNSSSSCGTGSGCTCRVTGTQFLRADSVMHLTACVRQGSGVNKRYEDALRDERPCPCNATYVSHRCCDAGVDGLVWEPAHAKLGEVFLEHEPSTD